MNQCFLCGKKYHMGNNTYDGKFIKKYHIEVCRSCYLGNADGWSHHNEQAIIDHLSKQEIPIPLRQTNGFLPRE